MKATINKSATKGIVSVPASKSLTIRALMCAALSTGESQIINPLVADDSIAAVRVLSQIGAEVQKKGGDTLVVSGGKFHAAHEDLDCNESATTMRMMTAVCSLIPGTHRLVGGPSLSARPIGSLVDSLKRLGVKISTEKLGCPPVNIEGGSFRGGFTEIPGNVSSQFITALLFVSPFSPKGVRIKLTTPLTSKPYILMTLWCLKQFNIVVRREGNYFVVLRQRYLPTTIKIESDWSSASYFLALGAMSEAGIVVQNMNLGSLQGDRIILDILREMGAHVTVTGSQVAVKYDHLKGIHVDLSDCIDLLPTVAILGAVAKGTTDLIGIQRARIKESNRVAVIRECLGKLGVIAVEHESRLVIQGADYFYKPTVEDQEDPEESKPKEKLPTELGQVILNCHDDHRIAMAFGVLGSALGNVVIKDAECVRKSYPKFWDDFKSVGGEVTLDE